MPKEDLPEELSCSEPPATEHCARCVRHLIEDMPRAVLDEAHTQNLLARAMRLDRKIAVGNLAAGVAHEVNNPLGFARSNIQFVLDEFEAARTD